MNMQDNATDLCVVLMRVIKRYKAAVETVAHNVDITLPQIMVLQHLYQANMIMGNVAKSMHCDASNITGIVDRLEAQGYIERQPSATDRRAKELCITPSGRQLINRLMATLPDVLGINKQYAAAELKQLTSLLMRIAT